RRRVGVVSLITQSRLESSGLRGLGLSNAVNEPQRTFSSRDRRTKRPSRQAQDSLSRLVNASAASPPGLLSSHGPVVGFLWLRTTTPSRFQRRTKWLRPTRPP